MGDERDKGNRKAGCDCGDRKAKSPCANRGFRANHYELLTGSIHRGNYMRKRRIIKQEEERRHPDSPDGLLMAAAVNKSFAERLIGVFRLAKAGVKDERR